MYGYNNSVLKVNSGLLIPFFTLYALKRVDIYSLHIGIIVIRDIMEVFGFATVVV